MPNVRNDIRDYLNRLYENKPDDCSRSTREVADYCGVALGTARRHLHALLENGDVLAFDGGASGAQGNPIFWEANFSQ